MSALERQAASYLKELKGRAKGASLSRIEGFFDNLLAAQPRPTDDPRQRDGRASPLWVPGLPARPWHDPARLPWLAEVAAAHAALMKEGRGLLEAGLLKRSEEGRKDLEYQGWLAFDLMTMDFDAGPEGFRAETRRFPENRARAPRAAALLERLPFIGDCFYSVLGAGGVVDAHYSQFNAKLICHLGLSVPKSGCGIRVAGEERAWKDREFLLFDDTFLHDTWNRSKTPRLLFHMGVWHPDLTPFEIEALKGWFAAGGA